MLADALPTLDEPKAGRLTIQYGPTEHDDIVENPPRFTWIPVIEDDAAYVLRISSDPEYPKADTLVFDAIPHNFFTPDKVLAPGTYHWSYATWDKATGKPSSSWGSARSFTIAEGLQETPLPPRATRLSQVTTDHPRLWMTPDRLKDFKTSVAADPDHCAWSIFYEKSVLPWLDRDVTPEPAGYPKHQRTAPVWRQTYIDLQEVWYAIRHLAVGGKITDNADMTARAKEWLLETASWDPMGVTSRAYTDEWAYRVCNALAWGYDWLYDDLSEDERRAVRASLLERTRDIAEHAILNAKIHLFPYDSHAVRSVSLVIVPACIALLGDDEDDEARDWLNYAIEFLMTVYSPWGDSDGGWAEGAQYWMMGMAYLIDAANRLKSYTGIDVYKRPFFQNTADFPLFCNAPNTRRASFGDDSALGDLPAIKTGLNMRQFAGVTGKGEYQWYAEENLTTNPGTEMAFYNWGWWDTNFDEMVFQTDFPAVAAQSPKGGVRHFKGIGWVGVQHAMDDPDNHIQFVFKSSRFGSVSHSHGDQNAFCLSAYGEDLAIQSGYYVAFNSTMHRNWRRQTRSKNAILINGKGQYAEKDKAKALLATGKVIAAEESNDHVYICGDATAAYQSLSPEVTRALREVYFVHNSYFVIVDKVDADMPVTVDWLLHANEPFELGKSTFRNTQKRAGFYGQVVWSEGGNPNISQATEFTDVDPAEYEGLTVSTCLTAHYPAATRHRIATLLVPYRLSEPKRIFNFMDDQGYDADLYFTDPDEHTFKVVMKKLANS
ncbi:DUF4962 domain-containing protein [Cognatiyoonia sp. IB215182]|uniref:DUF4962 domain-containing protein n=1 Tax=Cognatiyoonia sp. IB215182 TaxID=3097353 RepID=UPI002A0DD312|nr:DUF4962 domain-containing protein [Cognatiyoonia sp. IB215182]MDX8355352.1 DUF4962 domain-containing protein [Cognatiyoonia sp. IB215182]